MLGKQKNRWDVERKAGKNPEKKLEGISTISNTSLHMIPNTCQHKDLYVSIV